MPKHVSKEQFLQVEFEDTRPNPCSPEVVRGFSVGILLQAPSRVYLGIEEPVPDTEIAWGRVPLCGFSMVFSDEVAGADAELIVARDVNSGVEYRGELSDPPVHNAMPDPSASRPMPKPTHRQSFGGYFNVNLNQYVELPAVPATYDVSIVHGPYESNHVMIEVVPWTSTTSASDTREQ